MSSHTTDLGHGVVLNVTSVPSLKAEEQKPKPSSRRPDIDLIRVVLTWGILLYHVVLIYAPYAAYYVRIIPDTEPSRLGWATSVPEWHLAALWFIISMNAWNMPMFFFLSGIRWIISNLRERLFEWEMFQRIFRAEEAK